MKRSFAGAAGKITARDAHPSEREPDQEEENLQDGAHIPAEKSRKTKKHPRSRCFPHPTSRWLF